MGSFHDVSRIKTQLLRHIKVKDYIVAYKLAKLNKV